MRRFASWLTRKWRRAPNPTLRHAYLVTFSTPEGRQVLQDWLDEIYCQPCPAHDALALAEHNGQRKFIHQILEALDHEERPEKYTFDQGA